MDTTTKIPGNRAVPYMHEEMLEASNNMIVKQVRGKSDRNNMLKMTEAEKSILNAIVEVEKIGAHVELTNTVCLLMDAKHKLSDYLDDKFK